MVSGTLWMQVASASSCIDMTAFFIIIPQHYFQKALDELFIVGTF
jgi:hypothetical protein